MPNVSNVDAKAHQPQDPRQEQTFTVTISTDDGARHEFALSQAMAAKLVKRLQSGWPLGVPTQLRLN
jgi:hypothetical protein